MNQMGFTILLAKYLKTKYLQQPDLEYRFSMKGRFFAVRFQSESKREQTVINQITPFERRCRKMKLISARR